MRKPDTEVREVFCSETGKAMPKIPLWMAGIKVKFVCDEARQRSTAATGLLDMEPLRRSTLDADLDKPKGVRALTLTDDDADETAEVAPDAEADEEVEVEDEE